MSRTFSPLGITSVLARGERSRATGLSRTSGRSVGGQQSDKDVRALELGKPIERELVGDQAHWYRIALTAGQYLHVVVDQRGIDVVVTLFSPDEKELVKVDSPNGTQGPEPVSVIAETAGNYRLEVRSPDKTAAGRYEAKIKELRTATTQDRRRLEAETLFSEGVQLTERREAGAMRKAIDKFQAAIPLWQAVPDRQMEARTNFSVGKVQRRLGDLKLAIESFSRALPLFEGEKDLVGEADTLNDMGSVYDLVGDGERAIELHTKALVLFQKAADKRGEGAALNNLAGVYWRIGDLDKALEFYKRALPLPRALNDLQAEATVLGNIGEVYRTMGEYQQAFDYYDQSLGPTRAVKDYEGEGYTLDNMGSLYSSLGDLQTALPYLSQALEIRRRIGDRTGEEISLGNLGSLYHRQRDFAKAIEYYEKGLALARSLPNPEGEATTLTNLGRIHLDRNEPQKAIDSYQGALVIAKRTGSRPLEAKILHGLGQAYAQVGDAQKTVDYYNQALPVSQASKDHRLEALIKHELARGERERGNLLGALPYIEEALAIVESVRTKIGIQELRSSYFATIQDHYEFYTDLLMRLHKQHPFAGYDGKALQASEGRRARSLLETLAEANAKIDQGVDPKLILGERSLQQQLNGKAEQQTRLLGGKYTEQQAKAIAGEIETLTTAFQQAEAQIRQTSPRYAALTQPRPLDLKGIQGQLNSDTLLLEYSLGAEHSYLWAVSPTEIKSYELPNRAEIETAARSFYELLNTPNRIYAPADRKQPATPDTQQQEILETASRLSQMLLGPAAEQLGQKRLLVVADGALQYVPFAALPDPRSIKQNTAKMQPLIMQHEIVNLPSVSILPTLRSELAARKSAPQTLAVLADPVFYPDDERIRQDSAQKKAEQQKPTPVEIRSLSQQVKQAAQETRPRRDGERLLRLKGTRKEAEGILALVPATKAKAAFDFAASRAFANSGELSQYRYVHFATHGLLDSIHPELTAIVLSLVDENGNPQDGFLRAHEVYNLNLPADVVVLSGCQTGLGKAVRGEGLIGLTRGFMYAGAARVVVSLWSVDDEATAKIMVSFYRGMIKEGKRPAEALRAAQIEMLKSERWQAPYYWGAFVLQGEWR